MATLLKPFYNSPPKHIPSKVPISLPHSQSVSALSSSLFRRDNRLSLLLLYNPSSTHPFSSAFFDISSYISDRSRNRALFRTCSCLFHNHALTTKPLDSAVCFRQLRQPLISLESCLSVTLFRIPFSFFSNIDKQMERWHKSLHGDHQRYSRQNPSFSSSLLDAIYRSFDEDGDQEQKDQLSFCRGSMKKQKQSNCLKKVVSQTPSTYHQARLTETWREKTMREKVSEFDRRTSRDHSTCLFLKSSSSSSDSSSGGGLSSSESESFYGMHRPKPIRTSFSAMRSEKVEAFQKPNHENGFVKTKSKALRILYGDLKKAKHPRSPGAKLASFVNSLFTAGGNPKKVKVSNSAGGYEAKSEKNSTCSTASSVSRSCLSKTPSSSRSGTKRSVRFCPVSVIVDGDSRPCGHKNLSVDEPRLLPAMEESDAIATMRRTDEIENKNNEELRFHVMQESLRVEKVAIELLKNYQKKNKDEVEFDMHYEEEDEDDEDDDADSCASSDLFELDNLSAIGVERYREELPVFETTNFSAIQAIANGFIQ